MPFVATTQAKSSDRFVELQTLNNLPVDAQGSSRFPASFQISRGGTDSDDFGFVSQKNSSRFEKPSRSASATAV